MTADMSTIGGLLIAVASLIASLLVENGSLSSLISPSAAILILGGTIGATVIGYRKADIRSLPGIIKSAFASKSEDPRALIEQMVTLSQKARREGLLGVQTEVSALENKLLARGLQLAVDGIDPEVVQQTMATDVRMTEVRLQNAAGMLSAAGGYAPTMGIIGTVMGLVQVLSNLSAAEELGHSIALAFLATFYGIASANLFWLPLASKVKQNIQYQVLIGKMCIEGVHSLQIGEAPRVLQERLELYLPESDRTAEVTIGESGR